jgi:hypothetical protein
MWSAMVTVPDEPAPFMLTRKSCSGSRVAVRGFRMPSISPKTAATRPNESASDRIETVANPGLRRSDLIALLRGSIGVGNLESGIGNRPL